MSTLMEIETAISQLPVSDAEILQEWLEQWLEDQRQMTPEFLASMERGKVGPDAERADWDALAADSLARAYGPDEPEYSVADIKRPV